MCSAWTQYEKARKNNTRPSLADYSYVGYECGDKPLPQIKGPVFKVTDYGANPDDGKSDKAAIIKAIAAAASKGGGVIFFPKGRFCINAPGDDQKQLININHSNIVLRGSGSKIGGTELFMEQHLLPRNPDEMWTTPFIVNFDATNFAIPSDEFPNNGKRYQRLTSIVRHSKAESMSVIVKSAKNIKVGDWVAIKRKDTSPAAIEKALAPYTLDPEWTDISKDGVQVLEHHQVAAIQDNTITFREPVHFDTGPGQSWSLHAFRPLEQCGVEDIAFVGNWKDKFVHHKSSIHDGGWSMLHFKGVANSWITRCRFTDVNCVAHIDHSTHVTASRLLLDGNRGHSAVTIRFSSHCLAARIKDVASHWHACGVSKYATGNVFWRLQYPADSSFESHAQQPRHTLFDVVEGGFLDGRWGGAAFNQPNHLEGLVLWNYKNLTADNDKPYEFFKTNKKYGKIIMPDIIGFHGGRVNFVSKQLRIHESQGKSVQPESLYEAQVILRKKTLPTWLEELKK